MAPGRVAAMDKRKALAFLAGGLLLIVGGLACVGVARPFPCRSREHHGRLWKRWSAWHGGELTDAEMLRELVAHTELGPSFGEKAWFVDGTTSGGYGGVNSLVFRCIGEMDGQEAFDILCKYAVCDDRKKHGHAVRALEKRGDRRAVPFLMELLRIEDERQREAKGHQRNPHLLTCHVLRALTKIAGQDAAPLLREFVNSEKRVFDRELRIALFKLENDISKPINVERHQVTIKLSKTVYKRGEEMMLDYSATTPVGTRHGKLSAFGTTVLIDGNMVKHVPPNVYSGGFSSHGSVSLSDLTPGAHTLTVRITGTDKSDSANFTVLENTVEAAP